ncbi:TlpA family protein disulfide reductase [Sunxiuqinia elliptica]|uniref:Peroxiredoxin n=1 Tax=Sunxiuqinia elliptica TaxID=655355 RepID=A0A1I2JN90_9BACT|nr:TlpA disulfide reductase family protein [Sunxiuqinia elliptica]SFF55699.1 Peroxiredoxin [Sunxiuqinia elliptica]
MKNILLLLVCISFTLVSKAQKTTISGEIQGIEQASINLLVLPLKLGEKPIFKKVDCMDGRFECSIDFESNMWHLVRMNSNQFTAAFGEEKSSDKKLENRELLFFIRPGDKIAIKAKLGEYGINYQVYGNEISEQRNQVAQRLFALKEEYNKLILRQDTGLRLRHQQEQIEQVMLEIIVEHPNWICSAEMLAGFPEDAIAKHFKAFTPEVQHSFFGTHLSTILNEAETGTIAPDFTLFDEKGKRVSLTDFRGKYVILEFWGSWCGYCLKGIPKMKAYYSRYQDQVTFIGIACRDNKVAWKKVVADNDLYWVNLFAQDETITEKYGVMGYPTKVIIDEAGTIVWKTTGESDEFYDKIDRLFENVVR